MASDCETLSPCVPPQYRDFIIICTEKKHTLLVTLHQKLTLNHSTAGDCVCVGVSHLEAAVGHVTDVDDAVRTTEHLSKPGGKTLKFSLKLRKHLVYVSTVFCFYLCC